jgi:DNA polymerase III sliding clamp (beta) subunit (PCNA family)
MSLVSDTLDLSPKGLKPERKTNTVPYITLTKEQALSIASFTNATDTKDHRISLIKILFGKGVAKVSATNRFIVAQQTFETNYSDIDLEVLLHPEAIKFIKTTKTAIGITVDNDELTITKGDETLKLPTVKAEYPKIDYLFDSIEETNKPVSDLRLNFELLAKIAKLQSVADIGSKSDSVFDIYLQGETETSRPKAVLLKRDDLRVLVQPMLPTKKGN